MNLAPLYVTLLLAAAPDSWPGFLGQGASPVAPATIPLTWSPTENIAWTAKLPGKGQSSPVIWQDRVYVTSIQGSMKDTCQVTALSLADGSVLWTQSFPASQMVRSNYFQSRSASTPCVDADGVYAFFETGNLVALTHAGELRWQRSLTEEYGPFESTIGLATSPCQTEDKVILLIDHEGPSYLLAVNKSNGENAWLTERDSRVSYSSPALVPVGDGLQIVCSSSGSLDGYDPQTGERLWTYSENIGGNRAATPLPCGNGRFVMAASPGMHNENEAEARQSNGLVVIEPMPTGFAPRVLWRTGEAMPSFNTPTIHEGIAYWVNRAGVLFAFDAETGSQHYAKRAGQSCWATPVVIGDRLYLFGKDGKTAVVRTGSEFELLAENELWDVAELGAEGLARERAADGGSRHGGHGRPAPEGENDGAAASSAGTRPTADSGSPTGRTDAGTSATADTEQPLSGASADGAANARAERRSGGAPGAEGGSGGRPAMTAEQEAQARAQGEDRFADPVQYGVAIVSGSLVIRTGDKVYCIRATPASNASTDVRP